jgi:hypothetical protein
LKDKITTLYKTVLEFLLKAYRYYSQSVISRIATNTFTVEEGIVSIAKIKSRSNEVEDYMVLVSDEMVRDIDTRAGTISDALQRESEDLKQLLSIWMSLSIELLLSS